MSKFQAEFPDRMFDVGIAEQHSVAFATGLAMGGMRPVVALYSTFLQRAFDQTVHDVCQNDQPVLIAVDRAGLVGEDGTSHQGMFTLPAQRQLPNLVIASPKDEQELRSLLHTAMSQDHPFALHYPRDAGFGLEPVAPAVIPVGRGEVLREGRDLLFVGFGPIVARAVAAADVLAGEGWSIGVINARYARPLDRQLILDQARGKRMLVTFEESVVARRVRERGPRAGRGGPPGRPGLPRAGGPHPRDPGRAVRGPRFGGRPPAPAPARRRRAWPPRCARPSTRCAPRPAAPRSPPADVGPPRP